MSTENRFKLLSRLYAVLGMDADADGYPAKAYLQFSRAQSFPHKDSVSPEDCLQRLKERFLEKWEDRGIPRKKIFSQAFTLAMRDLMIRRKPIVHQTPHNNISNKRRPGVLEY